MENLGCYSATQFLWRGMTLQTRGSATHIWCDMTCLTRGSATHQTENVSHTHQWRLDVATSCSRWSYRWEWTPLVFRSSTPLMLAVSLSLLGKDFTTSPTKMQLSRITYELTQETTYNLSSVSWNEISSTINVSW